MSSETSNITTEPPTPAAGNLNFNDTELTLGLPGHECRKSGVKRMFSDMIDLKLGGSTNQSDNECNKPRPIKEQVVGWPPVRSLYKKNMSKSDCKYVKVAVDGAPYLRKVDLELYKGYQQLLGAFEDLFSCYTIRNVLNEMKVIDRVNGMEYVPTYEDKDGDWMLVGDVPWTMFVESCKRIRLMKSSEAINGSDLRTSSKCLSS